MTEGPLSLSSLTLFFPAYNEEHAIAETIRQAENVAQTLTDDYEILIINDGSKDRTGEIVAQLAAQNPNIRLIDHPTNLGYGAALMSGFSNATKEWTFFSDGDGQFDLSELASFISYTKKHPVIIGYRKERNDPFMRLVNAKGWNVLNRLLFGLSVRDIDCAFKLIKTDTLRPILPTITSRGAMISAELLVRLQRAGHAIVELPVAHYPRITGSATGAKPKVIIRAFREMARVYRGDLGPGDWGRSVNTFIVNGILNTITDIGVYLILTRSMPLFALHTTWAKGLSYGIGLAQSYLLNQMLPTKPHVLTNIPKLRFAFWGLASLAINTGVMYVSYNNLHIGELQSLALATLVTLTWNLLASKLAFTGDRS